MPTGVAVDATVALVWNIWKQDREISELIEIVQCYNAHFSHILFPYTIQSVPRQTCDVQCTCIHANDCSFFCVCNHIVENKSKFNIASKTELWHTGIKNTPT